MSYIQIPGGGGTGGGIAIAISGNTSGALATISSGTARLFGGNNITLSQNGQSVTISAANSNPGTLTVFEPIPLGGMTWQTRAYSQSALSLYPIYVPVNVSASQFFKFVSVSLSSSSNSSVAAALSESMGIYTLTGSTLNLITASSGAANVQFTNTNNVSFNSINGMKGFTIPITMNATPGNYYVGIVGASATTNTNWVSLNNVIQSAGNTVYSGQIGEVVNATRGYIKGLGFYSVQTGALPATIGLAELSASNVLSANHQYMNFQG